MTPRARTTNGGDLEIILASGPGVARGITALAAAPHLTNALAADILQLVNAPLLTLNLLHASDLLVRRQDEWSLREGARDSLVAELGREPELHLAVNGYLMRLANTEPVDAPPSDLPRYLRNGPGYAYHSAELDGSIGLSRYSFLAARCFDSDLWILGRLAREQVRRGILPADSVVVDFLEGLLDYRQGEVRSALERLERVLGSRGTSAEGAIAEYLLRVATVDLGSSAALQGALDAAQKLRGLRLPVWSADAEGTIRELQTSLLKQESGVFAHSVARDPENPGADPSSGRKSLTAAAFYESGIVKEAPAQARLGWRGAVNRILHTHLLPGPSERRWVELLERIREPIEGTRRIVVMSRKGGVGKTSVTLCLGATFAQFRGDRVIAVDANPDAGNLVRRVAGDGGDRSISDLLNAPAWVRSYQMMRQFTAQCSESRLEVLPADDDARVGRLLDREAYKQVISLLDHYYNLILLDTGTGLLDSANQGLISQSDQLVLVIRPALDGARAGAQTLDWLEEHGYSDLVESAVVAINGIDRKSDPIVSFSERHFAARCARVIFIPWDRALESGGRTTLSMLERRTRSAFLEMAASVAEQFPLAPRGSRAGTDSLWGAPESSSPADLTQVRENIQALMDEWPGVTYEFRRTRSLE